MHMRFTGTSIAVLFITLSLLPYRTSANTHITQASSELSTALSTLSLSSSPADSVLFNAATYAESFLSYADNNFNSNSSVECNERLLLNHLWSAAYILELGCKAVSDCSIYDPVFTSLYSASSEFAQSEGISVESTYSFNAFRSSIGLTYSSLFCF